jgi:hypothetical protein
MIELAPRRVPLGIEDEHDRLPAPKRLAARRIDIRTPRDRLST